MPCSVDSLVASEGLAALGAAEVLVLEKLSTQVRACIGTCGGGGGAAARGNAWRYLFGQLTIWLGEHRLRGAALLSPCCRSVCNTLFGQLSVWTGESTPCLIQLRPKSQQPALHKIKRVHPAPGCPALKIMF